MAAMLQTLFIDREFGERMRFHNLEAVADKFDVAFGINVPKGLKSEDADFAELLFHRRTYMSITGRG